MTARRRDARGSRHSLNVKLNFSSAFSQGFEIPEGKAEDD